jgi:integrase
LTQRKTGQAVEIPVHPDLAAVLDLTPKDNLVLMVTERGGPFSESHFTNWFQAMCRDAGLPGRSVHGLRKAACRRLAEAGCTEHEIAAISGHRTLEEVARYTRAADRGRMARSGMAKMAVENENGTGGVKPASAV